MKKLKIIFLSSMFGIFALNTNLNAQSDQADIQGSDPQVFAKINHERMHEKMHERRGNRLEFLTKELNLTPDQQNKINSQFEKDKKLMDKLWEKQKNTMKKSHEKVNSILTPEQKAKLENIKNERKEEMMKNYANMKGDGNSKDCKMHKKNKMHKNKWHKGHKGKGHKMHKGEGKAANPILLP